MNSLPVNTFKQALNANRRQVGLWVTIAHQQVAEAPEARDHHPVPGREDRHQHRLHAGPGGAVDEQGGLVLGAEHRAVEGGRLRHGPGHERVELAHQRCGHGLEHAGVRVDGAGAHEQALRRGDGSEVGHGASLGGGTVAIQCRAISRRVVIHTSSWAVMWARSRRRPSMRAGRPMMAWLFQRFLHNLRRYTDERYGA